MHLNLKQLQAFVWVSDLGSFRKAADRLNTTQPNISARISGLESTLNVSLMDRDAGSVRLTSKGYQLLDHARLVLRATENLIEAAGSATLFDGTLRLGVTEMIVHTWLRDFLRVLKDRFPNISVELTVDMSVNLEKELFERTIDLALQNGPFSRESSGQEDLGAYSLVWVASKTLNLHQCATLGPEDLVRHPILTHARDTRLFKEVSKHFNAVSNTPARLVPSSNLAACLHMTIEGLGIATLPAAMVSKELAAGDLVKIQYDWSPESLQFFARYDAEKTPHFVARAAELAGEIAGRFNTGSGSEEATQ